MNDEQIFNTSLFENNFPDLAEQVARVCLDDVGMANLQNVKISYAMAKPFSNKAGKLYNEMVNWQLETATARSEAMLNTHIRYIERYMTKARNSIAFLRRVEYVNQLMEQNKNEINRVAYEIAVEQGDI